LTLAPLRVHRERREGRPLYIAFVKNKPRWQLGDVDLTAKSRQWWNEGEKAAGLLERIHGRRGALG